MKISLVIGLITTLSVSATTSYAQNTTLSLKLKDASLVELLDEIGKKSEFSFWYSDDELNEGTRVSLAIKDQTIDNILDIALRNKNLNYVIKDKVIIIYRPSDKDKQGDLVNFQQQKVSGIVSDATSGEPVIGANVVVEGTTLGVVTDIEGKFNIEVPNKNVTLVISYIGYNSEKIQLNGQTDLTIKLVPDITKLEEIVVVGYGISKKSDVTGSIASVSSKTFENQPVTNLTSAMQGRMSGVNITNNSGEPGGLVKIRIRGANSIQGGNDPLFVVDGIQLTSIGIQDLNVNDIESIEVLKDASSTAIYGSRGANGVVMITTKKGSSETTKVIFNSNFGISNRSYKYDLLDPVTYAKMVNESRGGASVYTDTEIARLSDGGGTDWQDAIFRTGYTQDYQLSVSGGTQKSSYYFSGNYIDQSGIVDNSGLKKYAFRSNIESKLNKKLTLGANIFINRSNGENSGDLGSKGNPVFGSLVWGPAEPIYNADGSYNLHDNIGAPNNINPVAVAKERYFKNTSNSAVLNSKLTYKILDYLTFDIIAGFDANTYQQGSLSRGILNGGTTGSSKANTSRLNWQNSNILTFHKLFGTNHDLTLTGVFEQSKGEYESTYSAGTSLPFENVYFDNLGLNKNQSIGSSYSMWALRSWVGRINYTFRNKYLITATYRADGSSKFPNNPWGYFPSAAIGWRVSEEPFIKSLNLFHNFKLRASWGITGNQAVSSFATLPLMNLVNYSYGTSTESKGYTVGISSNPNLEWEKTAQIDFGVDLGFFNNRLSFSADYFKKKTSDLLLPVLIPNYNGGGSYIDNVGKVENKGIEFTVSAIPVDKKDFTWNISLNLTSVKNKVIDLGNNKYMDGGGYGNGLVPNPLTRAIVGQPLGTFYGLKFLGIYQQDEAAEAAKYKLVPGDNKYLDTNGDYVIDNNDRQVIGHVLPDYTLGLDNTIIYKGFELNVFIQNTQGNQIMNLGYAAACTQVGDAKTITSADVQPWTSENPNNMWPSLTSGTSKEYFASSKWLQDGSFIRVKNLSLGYRIPKNLFKAVPLKVSVSVQNLLTITKYKGFDPEASTTGNTDIDGGVDVGAYPSSRTITFRLQFGL